MSHQNRKQLEDAMRFAETGLPQTYEQIHAGALQRSSFWSVRHAR